MARTTTATDRRRPPDATWPWLVLVVGSIAAGVVAVAQPREGDPLVFLGHAERVASGLVPYRDFAVEYPPLALLHLVLPRLLLGDAATPGGYQTMFSIFSLAMAAATGAAVFWLARHGWSVSSPRDTLLVFSGLALALAPVVIWRYDIMPTLLTALALVGVAAGRPSWAGAMLGLGAAAKIFPAFLGPPLLVFYLLRRRLTAAALLVVGSALGFGLVVAEVFVVAGPSAFSFLSYQDDRGIEIESLLGGIVLLADVVARTGAQVSVGFGSWQVASPLIEQLNLPRQVVEVAMLLALVAGGAISVARDMRRRGAVQPLTLTTYLAASLLLVMLANKVLSPQYLVWLLPFVVLLGRAPALILLAAGVLTTVIYPLSFDALVSIDPLLVALLNVRNLLLAVLFVVLVLPRRSESGDVRHAADHAGRDAEGEQANRQPASARGDDQHQ